MLQTLLCSMIHNVLYNMLRAKNPPSHFPLPGSGSASLQCPFIQQLLVGLALIIREGHATFRAGSIGGATVGAAVGGAWRRSGAGFDSRCGPVVLGRILGIPGQHLARNVFHAGLVVDFIQLVHGLPVQEVKPGIDHGTLSVPEGRHSEEASQVGYQHLGHARHLRQSNAPVADPRCLLRCPSAPGEIADAFQGCYGHGLHVLPITEFGEHVEEEVVEVAAGGEIVLGEDQGLLAIIVRMDAVLGLVVLEVEEIRCTDRQHVIQRDRIARREQ
jgi:hypothetical protein